jgi:hypothetical protein
MSIADLNRDILTCWDPLRMEWLIRVPASVVERQGARLEGGRALGSAAAIGRQIAEVIAAPGPHQREVRKRVARNNRKRFGP